ncbi:hypothetical protein [Cupriavidus pampae]|uniref:Uncharacterized protein n=1 Tax=Cupriavidus pampae TaxID=659251 RepID=A0ABN7YVX2_9BURK|nr:hypothetical protein [Cupriavidus pampae]CAG9177639.1 hypothetical protein LMG32289_03863 [Cupriavidus pampae]
MSNVVSLAEHKRRLRRMDKQNALPRAAQDDSIHLFRQDDGTYKAFVNGAYLDDDLLSVEHLTDLARRLARAKRLGET